MKQSEKLDLILKELYEYKYDGIYYSIRDLLNDAGVETQSNEARVLSKKLENDGFIKAAYNLNDCYGEITARGIAYCEGDSYTIKGTAINTINYNMNITNSPNANMVSQSSNVSIVITNYDVIKTKIKEIRESITNSNEVDENIKQEITECVDEIETIVDAGKKPKFAFQTLTHMAGSLAEVGLLVIELGKVLGYIPQ